MEHPAPDHDAVPVKLKLSGSKTRFKRSDLNVPLKFSQLLAQVRFAFPDVKDFNLHYVDEEGDEIAVTSDADLKQAHIVFQKLSRVLKFTASSSTEVSVMRVGPTSGPKGADIVASSVPVKRLGPPSSSSALSTMKKSRKELQLENKKLQLKLLHGKPSAHTAADKPLPVASSVRILKL